MVVATVYKWLLRLYPRQYTDQFGQEMTSVFGQAAASELKKGRFAYGRFVLHELASLVVGARDARGASLLLGALAVDYSLPADLIDAQRAVESAKAGMQKAIATNDFKAARDLCHADEIARDEVCRLRGKYRLPGT